LDSTPYLLPIRKFIPLVSYAIKALVGLAKQLGECFLQVVKHGP